MANLEMSFASIPHFFINSATAPGTSFKNPYSLSSFASNTLRYKSSSLFHGPTMASDMEENPSISAMVPFSPIKKAAAASPNSCTNSDLGMAVLESAAITKMFLAVPAFTASKAALIAEVPALNESVKSKV